MRTRACEKREKWKAALRSNFDDFARVMENEFKRSGSIIEYRAMHQGLTVHHRQSSYQLKLNISKGKTVTKILSKKLYYDSN